MDETEREPNGTFGDVIAELDHVDDPDVFERMKIRPALRTALEITRPENWWGTGLNPKVLFAISKDDGIPVAWVLPSAVLIELAAAPDRNTRMSVLLAHKQEIIDQCKEIIHESDDPWVANERALIREAVAVYEDGYLAAATALAVSIGDPLAKWASTPRIKTFKSETEEALWEKTRKNKSKYAWAAFELEDADTNLSIEKILIAPVYNFFTEYHIDRGENPPDSLSRHVVAHNPTLEHFSPENALLSLMLVTSILHYMQEWSEQVRWMDSE